MTDLMPPKTYARIPVGLELPQLIQVQLDSFQRLKDEGLGSLLTRFPRLNPTAMTCACTFPVSPRLPRNGT